MKTMKEFTIGDWQCMLNKSTMDTQEDLLASLNVSSLVGLITEVSAMGTAMNQTADSIKDKDVKDYLKYLATQLNKISGSLMNECNRQKETANETKRVLDAVLVDTATNMVNAINTLLPGIIQKELQK